MSDEVANLILERLNLVLQRISSVEQAQQLTQADILALTNAQREHTYGLAAKVDSLRSHLQNRTEAATQQRDQVDTLMKRLDEALERISALESNRQ